MTTARLICLSLLLSLATAPAYAEPFEAWEASGAIWGRDLATGYTWRLSRGANAHSPDVDGPIAVWVSDWSWIADIMAYDLRDIRGADLPVDVDPAVQSDPQVGWLGLYPDEVYYTVWRQGGGLYYRRGGRMSPTGQEIITDYDGWFDLDGKVLTWEGGQVELPLSFGACEPTTTLMVATAIPLLALIVLRRRHG